MGEAVAGQASSAEYPRSKLGEKLQGIAQLIRAGLSTRIYCVTLDGFDTHSLQADAHPSLTDLDDGDLKFHTDFRCVYASVLEQWLGVASAPLLGGAFEPLKVFTG